MEELSTMKSTFSRKISLFEANLELARCNSAKAIELLKPIAVRNDVVRFFINMIVILVGLRIGLD